MEVILLENIENVGRIGDAKVVADGYARNFLLPKKLAVTATKQNKREYAKRIEEKKQKELAIENQYENLEKQVRENPLVLYAKSGDDGKLFGSITTLDIVETLQKVTVLEIDKRKLNLDTPIKNLGDYNIPMKTPQGKEIKIALKVERASGE